MPLSPELRKRLRDRLAASRLRSLAGARAFERGERYAADGAVSSVLEVEDGIVAGVEGTETYRVRVAIRGRSLVHECSCPRGDEGEFCKHCVAGSLAWCRDGERMGPGGGPPETLEGEVARLRSLLERMPHAELVRSVLEHAVGDDGLRRRLHLAASRAGGSKMDVSAFEKALHRVVRIRGFVDYQGARDYVNGVDGVLDELEALAKGARAPDAVRLLEVLLLDLDGAMGSIDDSDGGLTMLRERAVQLHLAACRKARPNPVSLAERLFTFAMRSELEIFLDAARSHRQVLGPDGRAAYRQLAEADWAKVPARAPGAPERASDWSDRFRITYVMELLAELDGDVDARLAVLSRNLSSPYQFLRVAEVCAQAGRDAEGIAWAERGLKAFPDRADRRLDRFLTERYHASGRHTDAVALAWEGFRASPGAEAFATLGADARKAGEWPHWREEALNVLRHAATDPAGRPSPSGAHAKVLAASALVEIHLSEKDPEAAWESARTYGCAPAQWIALADRCAKHRPRDVLPVYRAAVERKLAFADAQAYAEVARLLAKLGSAAKAAGELPGFATLVADIRSTYARRRNLMAALDRARLPGGAPVAPRV